MNVFEACTKIAEIIQSGEAGYPESGGLLIQFFYEELGNDETPAMALALAKKSLSQ